MIQSGQQIQQLVEQFKDLKEDMPDQIMDKLKSHCSGLENNVNEKMTDLNSENKILLQVSACSYHNVVSSITYTNEISLFFGIFICYLVVKL